MIRNHHKIPRLLRRFQDYGDSFHDSFGFTARIDHFLEHHVMVSAVRNNRYRTAENVAKRMFGEFTPGFSNVWRKKVWRMNTSANGLLHCY